MARGMFQALFEIGVVDVLDIAFVAVLAYALIAAMRRARAGLALLGFAILGVVYVAARALGMQLTAWIFQGFFAIFVVILVVIFQEELRRLFERIAVIGLRRRAAPPPAGDAADRLARTVAELARRRIGALLVLPGDDPLERHLDGGIALDGVLSEALLHSLFEPHSAGHDGGVLVEGDRVRRFSVQLPLSRDFSQLAGRGTRHAAALGLAERTDALCIVVSEERGSISVARDGRIRELATFEDVREALREFRLAKAPSTASRRERLREGLRTRGPQVAASVGAALALWLVFVPGSQTSQQTFSVPVVIENLPPGFVVEKVDPAEVEVTFSGTRREFFLLDRNELAAPVDAILVELGRRSFELSASDLRFPKGLSPVDVTPKRVKLSVRKEEAAPSPSASATTPRG